MNMLPLTEPFRPHPNFDDAINRAICQSEIEGGVSLDELPVGAVLDVQTANTLYRIENRGDGEVLISGHPEICPTPVLVSLSRIDLGDADAQGALHRTRYEDGILPSRKRHRAYIARAGHPRADGIRSCRARTDSESFLSSLGDGTARALLPFERFAKVTTALAPRVVGSIRKPGMREHPCPGFTSFCHGRCQVI